MNSIVLLTLADERPPEDPRLGAELHFQPDRLRRRLNAVQQVGRQALGAEAFPVVLLAVLALARHVGIELERMPDDLGLQVGLFGQRSFEPLLADEAPRTNGVGNDVDAHGGIIGREAPGRQTVPTITENANLPLSPRGRG